MTTFASITPSQARRLADAGKRALYVHGSVYVHPYVFGSCRGRGNDPTVTVVRARYDDYTTYDTVTISGSPELYGPYSLANTNAIAYARGKVWFTYVDRNPDNPYEDWNVVTGIDVETLEITRHISIVNYAADGAWDSEIVCADLGGRYLYFGAGGSRLVRFDLDTLAPAGALSYTADVTPGFGWHSAVVDATHLYVANGTGDSGSGGGGDHLCVKVRLSDFTKAGSAVIPKTTDDMAQHPDWVFVGYEANLRPEQFGYGSGSIAIRKADMQVFYLPPLGPEDSGAVASYASLVFNNFYIDVKTNRHLYVVDITSDPSTWTRALSDLSAIVLLDATWDMSTTGLCGQAGAGTGLPGICKIPNELLVDAEGKLHMFCWPTGSVFSTDSEATNDLTSGLIRATMPEGFDLTTTPTIATEDAVVTGTEVALTGDVLAAGGAAITEQGFLFDTVNPPVAVVPADAIEQSGEFTASQSGLAVGTYYYRAYSVNAGGTGVGDIKSFTIILEHGFAGVVRRDGVVQAGAEVFLVSATTKATIASQVVGGDGAYRFSDAELDLPAEDTYHLFAVWTSSGVPFRTRVKSFRSLEDLT